VYIYHRRNSILLGLSMLVGSMYIMLWNVIGAIQFGDICQFAIITCDLNMVIAKVYKALTKGLWL